MTEYEPFEKDFDHPRLEEECRSLWEEYGIHDFDPASGKEVFSVDTPPPYVSAAHLHVGHAMSYAQAEFVVRYKRMCGFEIFYPMGFDDNGLPTERYVEQVHGTDKEAMSRTEFRQLCVAETKKGAVAYERLWRSLGLSVDWSLRYSTIDDHCRRTAQLSFLDLYNKDEIYRSDDPVIWDTSMRTSLAQADVETLSRKGSMHDIAFQSELGQPLVISTTRPELLPACVALFFNPEDERYLPLANSKAVVPLFNHTVPILTSTDVDKEFGTGLMMVCTFGDGEDVKKWREHKLETRLCISEDGRMTALARQFENLPVTDARAAIVKELKSNGQILNSVKVEQHVSVAERSGQPIEFVMAPQWFIRLLDKKRALLERSEQLRWYPTRMKSRLDHWIEGLKFDWNISRQRYYGVPFPVWYCCTCEEVIVPSDIACLPIDPLEDECPVTVCPSCGNTEFRAETDVMDTWMTSSLTPLINSNWAATVDRTENPDLLPMSVRVQAFEIIRTWLFYTLYKSHQHLGLLPWRDVMISGWGLNEQGKKISKRDLEKHTDANGFNRYDPTSIIEKYGADSLRFWAAGSHLGNDLRFNERDVKSGRKLVVKLWNAARFGAMQIGESYDHTQAPPFIERTAEDRWLLLELNGCIESVTEGFESYDFAKARESLERFFWSTYCDNYLEIVKDRFWRQEEYSEESRQSARATLHEACNSLIRLFAPFLPFVTEILFQRLYRRDDTVSIHKTSWPSLRKDIPNNHVVPEMDLILKVLRGVRSARSELNIGANRKIATLVLDTSETDEATVELINNLCLSLQAVARCREVIFGPAGHDCGVTGLRLAIVPD